MNAIELAVSPIKQSSIDAAEQNAKEFLATTKAKFEAAGWDINQVAPFPRKNCSDAEFKVVYKYRKSLAMLVKFTGVSGRRDQPQIVCWDDVYANKFIEQTKEEAALQYEMYVAKLIKKIGDVTEAKMGYINGLWMNSTLIVTKTNGSIEKWNTKCIINRSVYGKLFNQFPTRKTK